MSMSNVQTGLLLDGARTGADRREAASYFLPEVLRRIRDETEFAGKITARELAARLALSCPEVLQSLQYMEHIGQMYQLNGYWQLVVIIPLPEDIQRPRSSRKSRRDTA